MGALWRAQDQIMAEFRGGFDSNNPADNSQINLIALTGWLASACNRSFDIRRKGLQVILAYFISC